MEEEGNGGEGEEEEKEERKGGGGEGRRRGEGGGGGGRQRRAGPEHSAPSSPGGQRAQAEVLPGSLPPGGTALEVWGMSGTWEWVVAGEPQPPGNHSTDSDPHGRRPAINTRGQR